MYFYCSFYSHCTKPLLLSVSIFLCASFIPRSVSLSLTLHLSLWLLLLGCSPHKSLDISTFLMLSFSQSKPTWRPITSPDNARHKSSIALSDTLGLNTRIFLRLARSLLCSFLFSIYELVQRIIDALQSCLATFNLHIYPSFSFVHFFFSAYMRMPMFCLHFNYIYFLTFGAYFNFSSRLSFVLIFLIACFSPLIGLFVL